MPNDYDSQVDYINWVKKDADKRQEEIEQLIKSAFSDYIDTMDVEVVRFSDMDAIDLAKAICKHPKILKPILASCNIATRAIERDLGIKNLNLYDPKITADKGKVISGYVKPFLPNYIEIPTLASIDRVAFIDKEIRKQKGRWEKLVIESLNKYSKNKYHKSKFTFDDEQFELDGAYPKTGLIKIGIDIKRIEARRDIHKRCDEIVNKASKFKSTFPSSYFGVVIYYPFVEEHINIQNRLHSTDIDMIVFAGSSKDSITTAVKLLVSKFEGGNK